MTSDVMPKAALQKTLNWLAARVADQNSRRYLIGFLGCLVAFVIWWLLTVGEESSLHRFRPLATIKALGLLVANARFWEGLLETTKRLAVGLFIATVIGIPVGVVVGHFNRAHEFTYVPFQVLRFVSPLSWTPIAIITLGIGSAPVYFLVSIAAVWPIIINTAAGVRSADPQWIAVARCQGADDWGVIRHVLLRATFPSVLVGLQLALSVAWIVIVPAEMLGVASGLGYMILDFRDVNDYASIMALILVIGILGIALDLPLRIAVRRASWN